MTRAMAAKHGMTVDEFEEFQQSDEYKRMTSEMEAKMEAAAKSQGLTLEQFKARQLQMQMRMQQQQHMFMMQQQQLQLQQQQQQQGHGHSHGGEPCNHSH